MHIIDNALHYKKKYSVRSVVFAEKNRNTYYYIVSES